MLRLERRHSVEQVRLDRLDRSEVGAMVSAISATSGGQPSSAFVEALHRRTAGVPFVVEELMRVVGPRALVTELLEAELPWSLEEAVRQQLEGLDHWRRRRVVEALAVYGRAASFETLMTVTESDEADLLAALRALAAAGVVVEVSDDQFWFTHALVADAVVHQLLGRERRLLHERCFEAVRRAPVLDHASLAFHARGAERHDEIPAIARRGATRYLDRGLTFPALRLAAEGLAEAPNDPELLAVATEAAWRLDFLAEALATGLRWVKVAVEPVERIEALRFVARIHHELDDEPAALERLAELEALWAGLDDAAARSRGLVAGPAAHDRRPVCRRDRVGRPGARRRPGRRRRADRGAGAGRARRGRGSRTGRGASRSRCTTRRSTRRGVPATPCCSPVRSTTPSISCRRTCPRRRRCGPRCRPSARGSGSTSSAPQSTLAWEMEAAYSAGDLPLLRRVAAEGSQWWGLRGPHHVWNSSVNVGLALEEGRLDDALLAYSDVASCCPPLKLQHYQRFEIALAAARGDRDRGPGLFDALLAVPLPFDSANTLNTMIVLVEDLLALGIAPAEIRERLFDGWLADHPSGPDIRAHAEGLLSSAEGRAEAARGALAVRAGRPRSVPRQAGARLAAHGARRGAAGHR